MRILYILGGNVNWCSPYGKWYKSSSKNEKYNYHRIQQFHSGRGKCQIFNILQGTGIDQKVQKLATAIMMCSHWRSAWLQKSLIWSYRQKCSSTEYPMSELLFSRMNYIKCNRIQLVGVEQKFKGIFQVWGLTDKVRRNGKNSSFNKGVLLNYYYLKSSI